MKTHIITLSLIGAALGAIAQPVDVGPVQHTNGVVVSPTNFAEANAEALAEAISPLLTNVTGSWPSWADSNAAVTRTNLGLGATWLTNTNTPLSVDTNGFLVLGTNALRLSNSLVFSDSSVLAKIGFGDGGIDFNYQTLTEAIGIAIADWNFNRFRLSVPLAFEDSDHVAASRTNLGLGASWLTNSNAPATTNATNLTTGTLADARLSTNVLVRDTNGVAVASAWDIGPQPTNGVATLATNRYGLGWDELGRMTLFTPAGWISIYEDGDPAEMVMFIPGRVIVGRVDAIHYHGTVHASQIVGGSEGGTIENAVMQASMPWPMAQWQTGGAEAAGWTHVMTNSETWPLAGSNIPVGVVSNTGTNPITGQYWSLPKLLTNAFNHGGFIPTGAAAAGDPIVANGTGGHVVQASRTVRRQTTNDVSKTNWSTAGINSSTNLATSPFPTWTIEAGATYHLRYVCWWASDSTNAGLNFGVVFTNHLTPTPQNVGFGRTFGGSEVGFNSTTNSTDMWFMFPTVINGGSQSNRVVSGYMTFYAQSNSTMTFSWAPANNVTNVQTLKAGSTITLEKISP